MADINPTLSIITLHVNNLKVSIKTEIIRVDQKTRSNDMWSLRNPLYI